MLMLKLQRRGKKHQASYRLIVGEKRTKLNGKQVEELGWFNPHQDKYQFNKERILYWLKIGAKMTPTVNNLLVRFGTVAGKKIAVHKKVAPKVPQSEATEAPASVTGV